MPLLNNPEIRSYLTAKGLDPYAFNTYGLAYPRGGGLDLLRIPGTLEANPSYRLGEAMGGFLQDKKLLKPVGSYFEALASPVGATRATILSALLGALGGTGFGVLTQRDPLLWSILGAGVGGLGGYGLNELVRTRDARRRRRMAMLTKRSFYITDGQEPMQYIRQRLFEDGTISARQKTQMMSQLGRLPRRELLTLADLLRTAAGGAVGYIVAKFLLRFGSLGTAFLTGLGGFMGARMGGRPPRNVFGLEVDQHRDFFGRPRSV